MLLYAPSDVIAPHWDALLDTAEWLLSIQQPSGNWPHKASRHMQDSAEDDQLVQCVDDSSTGLVFSEMTS